MPILAVDGQKAAAEAVAGVAVAAAQELGSAVVGVVVPSEAGCTKPILKHYLAAVALAGSAVDQFADQIGYKLLVVGAVVLVEPCMGLGSVEERMDC